MRNASAGSWKRSGSLQADIVNLLIQGQGQPPEKKKCKAHLHAIPRRARQGLGCALQRGNVQGPIGEP